MRQFVMDDVSAYRCVILRGLPGSGKSTFAKRLAVEHGFIHLEADAHFYVNGEYRFDPARVADAHALVVRDALAQLQLGARVVVANTHARLWEMAGIVGAASLVQRSFCIVELKGAYSNIHDVPDTVISGMIARWEKVPIQWADHTFVLDGSADFRA